VLERGAARERPRIAQRDGKTDRQSIDHVTKIKDRAQVLTSEVQQHSTSRAGRSNPCPFNRVWLIFNGILPNKNANGDGDPKNHHIQATVRNISYNLARRATSPTASKGRSLCRLRKAPEVVIRADDESPLPPHDRQRKVTPITGEFRGKFFSFASTYDPHQKSSH